MIDNKKLLGNDNDIFQIKEVLEKSLDNKWTQEFVYLLRKFFYMGNAICITFNKDIFRFYGDEITTDFWRRINMNQRLLKNGENINSQNITLFCFGKKC